MHIQRCCRRNERVRRQDRSYRRTYLWSILH
nr:MAG TPA: glycoprotein [Caudoviricetes sp.]